MGEGPDGLPKGVDHKTLAPFPKAAGVAEDRSAWYVSSL